MKLLDIKPLIQEFRSAPQGGSFDKNQILQWLPDAKQLKLQLVIPNKKNIVVFEYDEFGVKDKFIILVDREDREDIVGYMWLQRDRDYWRVMDITIYPQYQKQGLGLDLYVKLIRNGFNLVNGYSLSPEIEKVWRKLPQFVSVSTWDKETNSISDMDERPKQDDSINDNEHRYFWLATSNQVVKEEMENYHPDHEKWFNLWLEGSCQLPGAFRTAKYGSEGDL